MANKKENAYRSAGRLGAMIAGELPNENSVVESELESGYEREQRSLSTGRQINRYRLSGHGQTAIA